MRLRHGMTVMTGERERCVHSLGINSVSAGLDQSHFGYRAATPRQVLERPNLEVPFQFFREIRRMLWYKQGLEDFHMDLMH